MYLGSLECWAGRQQIEIRGTLQRNLLAALLAAESNFISVDVLITELWEKKPPSHSENALQAHVSRLRKKFREAGGGHQARLLTLPSGYQLRAADDDVDAIVFIRALNEVRSHSVAEPARVIARLRMALSLWRGPVFGGPLGGPMCRGVAARLEAARSFATETLFDLELQCGHHNEAIPELSKLVEEQSLNERLCELLMVALYRSGRQTEALQVYQRMRRRLDADLGVEPSPTLRKYEEAVLSHDPVLNAGADHAVLRPRASGRLSLAVTRKIHECGIVTAAS
jgi:DNA-binding SARP family transcriptional activator